jgi:hypothetical protein
MSLRMFSIFGILRCFFASVCPLVHSKNTDPSAINEKPAGVKPKPFAGLWSSGSKRRNNERGAMAKMLHLLLDWEYPHWMMTAGAVLVAVGFIGLAFHRNRNPDRHSPDDMNAKGK